MAVDNIEYEGKILAIDVGVATERIMNAGGQEIGDYTFRRYVFDTIPAQKGTWVRLRTNGKQTTLTVKQISHDGVDGTAEWEVEVSDFDVTLDILKKSGLQPKGYQENRRTEFKLDGAMLSIDYWPRLSPYLEIEAKDKKTVEAIAEKLGHEKTDLVGDNTDKLYLRQGVNLDEVAELRF